MSYRRIKVTISDNETGDVYEEMTIPVTLGNYEKAKRFNPREKPSAILNASAAVIACLKYYFETEV